MLQHLLHTAIDKEKWDKCVSQSLEQVVYAFSWYLDVVSPGWEAVVDVQDEKYVTVMPLPVQKKLGITYVKQPYFCQQLGVFSILPNLSSVYFTQFLQIVYTKYRYVLNYNFNTDNTLYLREVAGKFHLNPKNTHYLKLDKPYSEIYKNYSRDRKNNLKKGKKADSVIVESEDVEPLLQLFKNNISEKIYAGVAASSYHLLRGLTHVLQQKKLVRLLYTKPHATGPEEAGVMLIEHHDKLIYIFNAADQEGRKNNGRMILLDYLIQEYTPGKYIFDFESPEVESIAYFYKSFGAEPVPFYSLTFNNLPWLIKQIREIRMRLYRFLFVR